MAGVDPWWLGDRPAGRWASGERRAAEKNVDRQSLIDWRSTLLPGRDGRGARLDGTVSNPRASPVAPAAGLGLVLATLAVAGFDLRTAVTSVSAELPEVTRGLAAPSLFGGVASTSAPLVFAVAGFVAPAVLRRAGLVRGLVAALAVTTAGLLLRAAAPGAAVFLLLGIPTLAGLGVANVALPAVVKELLPHHVGLGTAVYTAMLSFGTATAAALTVPVAQATGTWRTGLAVWALPSVAGVVLCLLLRRAARGDRTDRTDRSSAVDALPGPVPTAAGEHRLTIGAVARTRLGWSLAVLMGGQSASSYVMLSYLPSIAADHGYDARTGGLLLSLFSLLGLSASALPLVLGRLRDHRVVVVALAACWAGGDLLTAFRPGAAWVSVVLLGVGSSLFTVGLLLFPLRSRTPAGTAALSGFALAVAYVITAATVFTASAVRQATGTWDGVLVAMAASMVLVTAAGLVAGRPGSIEAATGSPPGPPVAPLRSRGAGSSSR